MCFPLPVLSSALTFYGEPAEYEALDHFVSNDTKVLKGTGLLFLFYGGGQSETLSNMLKVTQPRDERMLILCLWHDIHFKHLIQHAFPQTKLPVSFSVFSLWGRDHVRGTS